MVQKCCFVEWMPTLGSALHSQKERETFKRGRRSAEAAQSCTIGGPRQSRGAAGPFFFKFFSSSPSFGGCCFRVLGRLVLFLYVNIIAIPVSRSRSAYRVRLLHLLLLLLSSYNFFLVGAQHLTATTATL